MTSQFQKYIKGKYQNDNAMTIAQGKCKPEVWLYYLLQVTHC